MRNLIIFLLLLFATGCSITVQGDRHSHHAHGCDHKEIVRYSNGCRDHYCVDDYEVVIHIEKKYFYYNHSKRKVYIKRYEMGYISAKVFTEHRRYYYDKYKRHFYIDKEPYLAE